MSEISLNKFEKRDLVIKLHKEGKTYREIAHNGLFPDMSFLPRVTLLLSHVFQICLKELQTFPTILLFTKSNT